MLPVFLKGLPKQDKDNPFEKACNKNINHPYDNNMYHKLIK